MRLRNQLRFRSLFFATALACSLSYGSLSFAQLASATSERELVAVLQSNASEADKAIACKRLAIEGTNAAVAELAPLLKDEHLSSWARIALETIPGKAADEALLKATYTLQGRLLVGVINSIGVRRDAAAVDSLKTRVLDKDVDVASAAAVSLGKIGNSGAAQFLSDLLANAPVAIRSSVAQGIVLCGEHAMQQGNLPEAVKLYDKVRLANVNKQRTVEATRGAILARKAEGIPLLLETLRSPEKALFQVGLATAREMSGKAVDQALAGELTKAAPDRAALMIYAMADRKDTVELAAILNAAKAGPAVVRLAAINALGLVGNASCVPTLLSVAAEPDVNLSGASKTALANIEDEAVSAAILEMLPKAQGKMVATLIDVIGIRQVQATSQLVNALKNTDAEVRTAALKALGNTVPLAQMNVLVEQAVAPNSADSETAVLALKTAAVRMKDRDACATMLWDSTKSAPMASRKTIISILTAVGGAQALKAVHDAAKSDEVELKDASSKALGEWSTSDAAPVILDLLKSGVADKYRNRLFGGYLRIASQFVQDAERVRMCRMAMEQTRNAEEKEKVLVVLQRYPTIETLKLAIQFAETPELKEPATKAAIAIAEKVGNRAAEAKALLSKAGITP
jgi:HEAT repeat protein